MLQTYNLNAWCFFFRIYIFEAFVDEILLFQIYLYIFFIRCTSFFVRLRSKWSLHVPANSIPMSTSTCLHRTSDGDEGMPTNGLQIRWDFSSILVLVKAKDCQQRIKFHDFLGICIFTFYDSIETPLICEWFLYLWDFWNPFFWDISTHFFPSESSRKMLWLILKYK